MLRRHAGYPDQAVSIEGGAAGPIARRAGATALCTLALAVGAMAVPAAAKAGCQGANARPGAASAERLAAATGCLINERRRGHGIRRLRGNAKLTAAAVRHSRQMVEYRFCLTPGVEAAPS